MSEAFPNLAVSLFTEGLGAPERRLRDGDASIAIYAPFATGAKDLEMEFLASIEMTPVASADHPLSRERAPIRRETLDRYVQLVLTDTTSMSANVTYGVMGSHLWRFADLHSRLDCLLAGLGWCHMPRHMVEDLIAAKRLARLHIFEHDGQRGVAPTRLYVVYRRDEPPGRSGRRLIEDLRARLVGERGGTPWYARSFE